MPNGLLLIDKPLGTRSTECVAQVKRRFGRKVRVGHAGTLDSTASGLLVVLLGTATRLSDYVMKLPKVYRAVLQLGSATDTCDYSGQTVFRGEAAMVDERAVDRVLRSFWGTRMQRPPEVSALKVGGAPSHRLARAGGEMENKPLPRPVVMTRVERCSPVQNGQVALSVLCGKGTYIRAIARDMGEALGCGAHIASLRRLSIGPFSVEDADASRLHTAREVGAAFHRVILTEDAERYLLNGLPVALSEAGRYVPGTVELQNGLCIEGAGMVGFVEPYSEGTRTFLRPVANILDELDEGDNPK